MGYVVEHQGRWYAVNYEGTDPLTGRDRRRWHRAADEPDARAIAATLVSSGNRGTIRHGVTVARYLRTEWLPSRAPLLQPTTHFRYETMTEHYVVPTVGRVPLRSLNTGMRRGEVAGLR